MSLQWAEAVFHWRSEYSHRSTKASVLMLDTWRWWVDRGSLSQRFFIAVAAVNRCTLWRDTDQKADTTVEMLDTSAATPAWTAAPGLSGAHHARRRSLRHKLYVSGGMTPGIVNSVGVFDTATPGGVWQPGPSLNVAKSHHGGREQGICGGRWLNRVCFPAWRSWTRPRRRGGSGARTQALYSRSHSRL